MTLEQTLFNANHPHRNDTQLTPWLVNRLIHTGAMTETGLTRRARPRPCPTCRTWTVCGLDADTLALEARCDTHPLTQLGEVVALASGRRTLELIHTRGRYQLEQRWADHIEGRPAGTPNGGYDVLAEHRCHRALTAWSTSSTFTPTSPVAATGAPPF